MVLTDFGIDVDQDEDKNANIQILNRTRYSIKGKCKSIQKQEEGEPDIVLMTERER